MKRPFSLLEIIIGLALTTILLTSLFSSFRHLTQTEAMIEKIENQKHWEFVTQLRLNRIFENVPSHSVFSIEPYGDKIKHALHFTFDNGIDPDPQFCQVQEVYLGLTDHQTFCLFIEPKLGAARKEIFLRDVSHFKMEFFDPKEKLWLREWDKDYLPPLVKISLADREFFFVIPHANRMVEYA